jgi:hypothetical protein
MYSSVILAKRVLCAVVVALLSLVVVVTSATATTKTPVSVQVRLNVTSIRSGHSIHGTAILTNASSKSILIQSFNCYQWLYVGLANKTIPYDPAVPTSACPNSVTLKHGANRVPITVSTKYYHCVQGPQKGTIEVPRCTKLGMPALPKGSYHVVVLTNGLPQFAPYTSRIRVTLS